MFSKWGNFLLQRASYFKKSNTDFYGLLTIIRRYFLLTVELMSKPASYVFDQQHNFISRVLINCIF